MKPRFLLCCALLLLTFLSVHCDVDECETPNPDYDSQDPTSAACLDGLLFVETVSSNRGADPSDLCSADADCPEGQKCVFELFGCPQGTQLTVRNGGYACEGLEPGTFAAEVGICANSRLDCPPGTVPTEINGESGCSISVEQACPPGTVLTEIGDQAVCVDDGPEPEEVNCPVGTTPTEMNGQIVCLGESPADGSSGGGVPSTDEEETDGDTDETGGLDTGNETGNEVIEEGGGEFAEEETGESAEDEDADEVSEAEDFTPAVDGIPAPGASTCPYPEPWGYKKGEYLKNMAFKNCKGEVVTMYDAACGAAVSWVYFTYGW